MLNDLPFSVLVGGTTIKDELNNGGIPFAVGLLQMSLRQLQHSVLEELYTTLSTTGLSILNPVKYCYLGRPRCCFR